MSITTLPTQTEGSLGQVKSDSTGVYTPATDLNAALFNEHTARIVEVFQEVGLTDGTTPQSVNSKIAAINANIATLISDLNTAESDIVNINSSISSINTSISGINTALTGKASTATQITAGTGLTGGGSFVTDRTISLDQTYLASTAHAGLIGTTDYDAIMGDSDQWQRVYREVFKGALDPKLTSQVSGTGAVAQAGVAASSFLSIGRVTTGTTTTGFARHHANINWWYSNAGDFLRNTVVVRILGPLADGTDDYRVYLAGLSIISGSQDGFSFTYDRTVSANWLMTRWNTGVATHTPTSIPVDLSRHRFTTYYDRAAASVQFFIDKVLVGTVTSIPASNATYPYVGEIRKVAGVNGRELYEEFAQLDVKYTVARP